MLSPCVCVCVKGEGEEEGRIAGDNVAAEV